MEEDCEAVNLPGDIIDIQKSIEINAPVGLVFQIWSKPRNFPRFVPHVSQVRRIGKDRLHWQACGPLGSTIEWDAVITACVPNQVISWRSEPGAEIEQTGNVSFSENPDGSTRVGIRLLYARQGRGLGHAVVSLFGENPEREVESHLTQMKEYVERQASDRLSQR